MQTVYDRLSKSFQLINHTGDFGIEIETESIDSYTYPRMKFWSCKEDRSLRNFGIEYVLKHPVSYGQELDAALEEFSTKTKNFNFVKDSISTSVHVHLNFLQKRFITLANFMTTYIILENLLCRYSGPDRASNLFCLPVIDAEYSLDTYKNILLSINNKKFRGLNVSAASDKYAALNVCNLTKLGTLEIRTFRGATDIQEIKKWIEMLKVILDFSSTEDMNPIKIIELWRESKEDFPIVVMGDNLGGELLYEDRMKLMSKNVWYASRLAMTTKNWNSFGELKPKKFSNAAYKEFLERIAGDIYGKGLDDLSAIERITVEEDFTRALADKHTIAIFSKEDQ